MKTEYIEIRALKNHQDASAIAIFYTEYNVIALKSYNTIVCSIKNGILYRHFSGRTATTTKHIGYFFKEFAPQFSYHDYKKLNYSSFYGVIIPDDIKISYNRANCFNTYGHKRVLTVLTKDFDSDMYR